MIIICNIVRRGEKFFNVNRVSKIFVSKKFMTERTGIKKVAIIVMEND